MMTIRIQGDPELAAFFAQFKVQPDLLQERVMADEVRVDVASADHRITAEQGDAYTASQRLLAQFVAQLGLETAVGMVMSGFGRELRRYMSVAEIQTMYRQFANTMPDVVQYDR